MKRTGSARLRLVSYYEELTDTSAGHAIGVIVALGREAYDAPIKGANLRRINNEEVFVWCWCHSPSGYSSYCVVHDTSNRRRKRRGCWLNWSEGWDYCPGPQRCLQASC